MIPVTKPFLPPIAEYEEKIKSIWQRNWLTNNGPLVNELELSLKEYLNIDHLLFTSNGTIALQIALKALNITKEVITTPFSYIATTSGLVWEGCKPVFADIDPETLNINPENIEKLITNETEAIVATHAFGNPCDIERIQEIASRYQLKVVYDAAHCFGVDYRGKCIYEYGDISIASFHATKLFHTIEGGAVITKNPELLMKMAFLRNFGHDGLEKFKGVGINGKNSEFHAAMGICNLKYVDDIILERKKAGNRYDKLLRNLRVQRQKIRDDCNHNVSYYPIIFESEKVMLASKAELEKNEIFPRRYFFPSLASLDYIPSSFETRVCDDISSRILCLPLFYGISEEEQLLISRVLLRIQNN